MNSLQVHLFALLAAAGGLISLSGSSVASEQQANQTGVIEKEDLQLNATDSKVPMIEQTSEKGIYLVQLRWAQLQLDPSDAIALEIVFLNASVPRVVNGTEPPVQGRPANETIQGVPEGGDFEADGTLPVESNNITIYSDEDEAIWTKINQPGEGGRAGQLVELGSKYTGPVTIRISEIVPGWEINGEDPEQMTDAVTFSAVVVPEFPLSAAAAVTTSAVVSSILLVTRFHKIPK